MVACGDKELAQDIAQDSLAKAYARWKMVNDLESPAAWVRKVAINGLKDEFRKNARRNVIPDSTIELSTIEAIEKSLPAPMAVDFVRALHELPDQQRIAATLRFIDDASEREISNAMGISQGTVKTHLHHARSSLGETLSTFSS